MFLRGLRQGQHHLPHRSYCFRLLSLFSSLSPLVLAFSAGARSPTTASSISSPKSFSRLPHILVSTTPQLSMSSSLNDNESSKNSSSSIVKLNSDANDSRVCTRYPPTVLLHGLDSSSHTWRNIMEDMGEIDWGWGNSESHGTGLRALSIDQRGCGLSPLGDPNDFTPEALVEDLYAVLANHPLFRIEPTTSEKDGQGETKSTSIRPFVLVGHSMGGRIAMSFAAKYPELIVSLVIEDMDIRKRLLCDSSIRSSDRARTLAFDRNLQGITSPQGVVDKFVDEEGYSSEQVQKWLNEGRVEKVGNRHGYYSQVHPAFRLLCYEQFFETNHGKDTWNDLASILENQQHKFDVHLMIADPSMTVCSEESIAEMVEAFDAIPYQLHVHRFPDATHSIHNSQRKLFVQDLKNIIRGGTILRRHEEERPRKKPKRPVGAYNIFFKEQREKIAKVVAAGKEDPNDDDFLDAETIRRLKKGGGGDASFVAMASIISQRWKNIGRDGHSKYSILANEDMERYKREMKTYECSKLVAEAGAAIERNEREKQGRIEDDKQRWEVIDVDELNE